MLPPPLSAASTVRVYAAHGHGVEIVSILGVSGIEVTSGFRVRALLRHAAVAQFGHDSRFGYADELYTLIEHGSLERSRCRIRKIHRIPGKFTVVVVAILLPVIVDAVAVYRNILGPIQLYHLIQLRLVYSPFVVRKAKRPFGQHGRLAGDMGIVLHNILRLAEHDVVFHIVLEIPSCRRSGVAIVELQFVAAALEHGVSTVRVHQDAVTGGRPHERAAGIALLPGHDLLGGVVPEQLPVALEAGIAAQAVHILSTAAHKTHAVVKHAAGARLPEKRLPISVFDGHPARVAADRYLHVSGAYRYRVA